MTPKAPKKSTSISPPWNDGIILMTTPTSTPESVLESYLLTCAASVQPGVNFDERFVEARQLFGIAMGDGTTVTTQQLLMTLQCMVTNQQVTIRVRAEHFMDTKQWFEGNDTGWVILNTSEEWSRPCWADTDWD